MEKFFGKAVHTLPYQHNNSRTAGFTEPSRLVSKEAKTQRNGYFELSWKDLAYKISIKLQHDDLNAYADEHVLCLYAYGYVYA